MTAITKRIINIARSHFDTEVVDNYATTKARLNSALTSINVSLNAANNIAMNYANHDSLNYSRIEREYEKRVRLLSPLVENPNVENHGQIVSLYETAVKMRALAKQSHQSAATRCSQLNQKIEELKKTRDEIIRASSQLELAQTMVKGRERLTKIASRTTSGHSPAQLEYADELRNASRLAKEAEALAEIKGWGL